MLKSIIIYSEARLYLEGLFEDQYIELIVKMEGIYNASQFVKQLFH